MTTYMSVDFIIVASVIVLTIAIGVAGHRYSKTFTGFMFANRSLGPVLLSFSIMATYFSAASFLGGGGATYLYNLGFGAWLTAWHVIGVVLLWMLIADKLYEHVTRCGAASIPELVGYLYSSALARAVSATVIVVMFSLYLVSVYKGGAIVLSTQFGIDYAYALIIQAIPVIVYLVLGGMRGAVVVNLFLGMLMLIAAAVTFTYVMAAVGGPINGLEKISQTTILGKPGSLWLRLDGMGPPPAMEKGLVPVLIMSIATSIGIAQIALPNLLLQFYAARDRKAIARGRLLGPVLVALYAMLMFSLGLYCHLILDQHLSEAQIAQLMKDTDRVIPETVKLLVPYGLRGLVFAAPIAASMSTIALTVLTIANTFVRDIVGLAIKDLSDRRRLALSRVLVFVFALITIALALHENSLIIDIVSAAFGTIFACFVGPLTIGLYWRRASSEAAIASMIVGAVTGILWYIYLYRVLWIHPTILATALALATFFGISIAFPNRKSSR